MSDEDYNYEEDMADDDDEFSYDEGEESGYTTGATTGTDDGDSDVFDEDADPLTLLNSMMGLQPGEGEDLQPFEVLRQHQQHRTRGEQVSSRRCPCALQRGKDRIALVVPFRRSRSTLPTPPAASKGCSVPIRGNVTHIQPAPSSGSKTAPWHVCEHSPILPLIQHHPPREHRPPHAPNHTSPPACTPAHVHTDKDARRTLRRALVQIRPAHKNAHTHTQCCAPPGSSS
jgi:hypothetical protein